MMLKHGFNKTKKARDKRTRNWAVNRAWQRYLPSTKELYLPFSVEKNDACDPIEQSIVYLPLSSQSQLPISEFSCVQS